MKYRSILCVLFTVILSPAAGNCSEKLTSRDFGYGYMLNLQGKGAVYSLPVPHEVYTRVRRADLGDIRIFNGTGEEVPHAFRNLKDENVHLTSEVPFFPLYAAKSGGEDLSLSVRRDADGTIIDLDSSSVTGQFPPEPSGYLLDLGEDSYSTGSLEVYWQTDSTHASSSVKIEHSTDLQRWFPLVQRTTLVDLEYGGNNVVQRKVHLPRRVERYLKISWNSGSAALPVTRVTAFSHPLASRQNLQWVTLYNGRKVTVNGATAIDYSSNYRLPVRNVRLRFTEHNAIINASVQSRESDDQQWREQCRGVFYSITVDGQPLQSEPCSFGGTTDSQWRLAVLDDGAGLSGNSRSVMVDLGWQSDELLFLARGTPPFLLAYGSGKLENDEKAQRTEMVLSAVKQQGKGVVGRATIGKHVELGGESALVPPPPPKPWKTWMLWGVLVAGVVVMGGMAVSLFRDLKRGE